MKKKTISRSKRHKKGSGVSKVDETMTLQKIKVKEIILSWTKKPSREATISKTAKQPGAEILYDDIINDNNTTMA